MFRHVGDEFAEQATRAEQEMDATLGGAGAKLAVHAEAFAGRVQEGQQRDGESVEQAVSRKPGSRVQRLL